MVMLSISCFKVPMLSVVRIFAISISPFYLFLSLFLSPKKPKSNRFKARKSGERRKKMPSLAEGEKELMFYCNYNMQRVMCQGRFTILPLCSAMPKYLLRNCVLCPTCVAPGHNKPHCDRCTFDGSTYTDREPKVLLSRLHR